MKKLLALGLLVGLCGCAKKPAPYEYVMSVNQDGIPLHLYINGETWTVSKVEEYPDAIPHKGKGSFSGVQAETNCKDRTITYIQTNDPFLLRTNLMHEVFHAGDCLHGGDKWWNSEHPTNTVHPGIYHLGEFMATFVKMNPLFIKWEEQQ